MAQKKSPEYCTFRENYEVLKNLQHGISTISAKAFAAGIISKDLRIKCSNESFTETDRTKWLLNALEDKLLYVPATLRDFADILNDTISFEYIGKLLLTSLERESEVRKEDESQPLNSVHHSISDKGMHARSTTQLSWKMEPSRAMLQYRKATTPPPNIDDYHTAPILCLPSSSAPDAYGRKPGGNTEVDAKKEFERMDSGDIEDGRAAAIDSLDSDNFFTPHGSLALDSLKQDSKVITTKPIPALDSVKIEARRGSVEKLKEEVKMLKRQLSQCKKRDKDAEKQLQELREEMFKEICDLGEQLSKKMEWEQSQNFSMAKLFLNTFFQAHPSSLSQDRRAGWAEEGDNVSHTQNSSTEEFMHI